MAGPTAQYPESKNGGIDKGSSDPFGRKFNTWLNGLFGKRYGGTDKNTAAVQQLADMLGHLDENGTRYPGGAKSWDPTKMDPSKHWNPEQLGALKTQLATEYPRLAGRYDEIMKRYGFGTKQ